MSASIARSRRQVGTVAIEAPRLGPGRRRAASARRRPGSACRPAAGSVAMPTRASSAALLGWSAASTPSSRSTRAGRNGHARRLGLGRDRCRRRPAPTGPPAHSTMSRAVRSAPSAGEPMLLALLEPEARLGAQRVPERGAADADRVEDGRLDDHVRRRVADLRCRAAHDARRCRAARRIGDEQGLRVELAVDVVERLEPLARSRAAARRSGRRGPRPRRTCGSACRARASRSCWRRPRC